MSVINHCGMWDELSSCGLTGEGRRQVLSGKIMARTGARLSMIGGGAWTDKPSDEVPAGIELFAAHTALRTLATATAKPIDALEFAENERALIVPPAQVFMDRLGNLRGDTMGIMEQSVYYAGQFAGQVLFGDNPERGDNSALRLIAWMLTPEVLRAGSAKLASDVRLGLDKIEERAARTFPMTDIGDTIGSMGSETFKTAVAAHASALAKHMIGNDPFPAETVPRPVAMVALALLMARIDEIGQKLCQSAGVHEGRMRDAVAREHVSYC